MNELIPENAVSLHAAKATTTSLMVAEVFGKRHDHVLRDIEAISLPKSGERDSALSEFARLNFELGSYVDGRGKTYPMHYLTKDGFTLLVMGYTGEKAMRFKIAYIFAFNEMAERLTHGDLERGQHAERAYFKRYPERTTIRRMALVGEPYWYIGHKVGRSAGTVGKAIRHMIEWGMMEARQLQIARQGMASWWARRRQQVSQMTLGF